MKSNQRTAALLGLASTLVAWTCLASTSFAQGGGATSIAPATIAPPVPKPRDAADAIIRAFDTHSAVLLGEMHWRVAQHRFIQQLLHDRRLPNAVNDIAVEFANARYQPMIDRYIAGADVPADSLRQVWENSIVPLAWDVALYANVFRAVRAINRTLPANRRLRVLALDPPIAWDSIRTADDIPRRWGFRDPMWLDVLEREVFAKNRKVLVICGAVHILRRDPTSNFEPASLDKAGLGDALAQTHPGATYSVYPLLGSQGLAMSVKHWRRNTIGDIRGTQLAERSSHLLLPGDITIFTMVNGKRVPRALNESDFPPLGHVIDAIAYYGRDTSLAPRVLDSYRDSAYVTEMHRRSAVERPIFGEDLDSLIDALARAACRKHLRERGVAASGCRA